MKKVARAVVEAGLVEEPVLVQLQRWGIPIEAAPEKTLQTKEQVLEHIRESIEGEDMVRIDETALDLLHSFLDPQHKKPGRLILKDGKKHITLNIVFSMTRLGEVAIPWTADEDPALLLGDGTHLKYKDGEQDKDVAFHDYRNVYFGEKRAFVVCEVHDV